MSRYILAIAMIMALLNIGSALPISSQENVAPDNEIDKINSELDRIDEEEKAFLEAIDDDGSDEDEADVEEEDEAEKENEDIDGDSENFDELEAQNTSDDEVNEEDAEVQAAACSAKCAEQFSKSQTFSLCVQNCNLQGSS